MTPKLNLTIFRRPTLKLGVLPRYPYALTASSPILLSPNGGAYNIAFDGVSGAAAVAPYLSSYGYAPIASPTFTGDPKAPTPTVGDNDTSIATTAFVTTALAGFTSGRTLLTAARTYYVRTDGSNSNNGLTNSAGGAFLTIQKAVDTVLALDCSIYGVTISVGAGTFNENVTLGQALGSATMTLVGAGSTTIIQGGANIAIAAVACGLWAVQSLKILSTSYLGILASGPSTSLQLTSVEFGVCAQGHIRTTVGANVRCFGGCVISGSAGYFILADNKGNFTAVSVGITLTGTPAFGVAFVAASGLCYIWIEAVTFTGSATGPRYTITQNSVCYVAGAGITYLPGNAAHGTPTASGGQYL